MLKPTHLTLNVITKTRRYHVSWERNLLVGASLSVNVVTELKDGTDVSERFSIGESELSSLIDGIKSLETWFYEDFAYQYADLHRNDEESECTRASILFDLGNYTVPVANMSSDDSDTFAVRDGEKGMEDQSPVFYVRLDADDQGIYSFGSYENAEQWANEKLYQDETINVTTANRPYTIFTIKKAAPVCPGDTGPIRLCDAGPLDLPCSAGVRQDGTFDIPKPKTYQD